MLINLRNALMTGKRLPYDNEIEFLESTGSQYIEVPMVVDNSATVNITGYIGTTNRELFSFDKLGTNQFNIETGATYYRWWNTYAINIGSGYLGALHSYKCSSSIWVDGALKGTSTPTQTNSTLKLYILNGNHGATSGRIYHVSVEYGGRLIFDAIPVRVGTTGYLYDRVSGKLFGNEGSGDFVLGPDVVPVEYIESHGTEWIDTGVDPAQDLPFECTFSGQLVLSGYGNVFGSRYSSRVREYQLTCYNGGSVSIGSRTEYLGFGGSEKNTVTFNGTDSVNVNGTTSTIQTSTCSPTTGSIVLFGIRQNGTVTQLAQGRIYGVKFGIAANFYPVRVGTEGAMIDTLTRRVYRNAGTGAFAYGNDLKYPIPAA